MNTDDVAQLKYDRRLERRRGWLAPGEIESHLESLPDSADKVYDPAEDEAAAATDQPSAEAPADAPAPGGAPNPGI